MLSGSAMGSGQMAGSQMSPGQRPMQQPFSPHGHLAVNTNFNQPNQPQMGSGNDTAMPSCLFCSKNNGTFVSGPIRMNQPQSYGMQQQHHQTNSQLSPQPAIGARSSPGMQPNQPMSVVNWNSMNQRPQQQQQQHMMNFNPRGYAPQGPRGQGRPGGGAGAPPGSRPGFNNNGMDAMMMNQAPSNGMFIRQQSQQQPGQQQQQMRVQRTISAPSGAVPGKCFRMPF